MAFLIPVGGGPYAPRPAPRIETRGILRGAGGPVANLPGQPRVAPIPALASAPARTVSASPAVPVSPAAPDRSPYDYSSDPILQQIRASGVQLRDQSRASALAKRKRLAILLGDAAGIVDDAGTAEAARGNAFSTLAEIMRGYQRGVTDIDEDFNRRNLFFSGHRGQALARALEDKARQEYAARQSAQDELAAIDRELTQALLAADAADAAAEAEAANRAIARAVQYGVDPGAGQSLAPVTRALVPGQDPRINPIFYFK